MDCFDEESKRRLAVLLVVERPLLSDCFYLFAQFRVLAKHLIKVFGMQDQQFTKAIRHDACHAWLLIQQSHLAETIAATNNHCLCV